MVLFSGISISPFSKRFARLSPGAIDCNLQQLLIRAVALSIGDPHVAHRVGHTERGARTVCVVVTATPARLVACLGHVGLHIGEQHAPGAATEASVKVGHHALGSWLTDPKV